MYTNTGLLQRSRTSSLTPTLILPLAVLPAVIIHHTLFRLATGYGAYPKLRVPF